MENERLKIDETSQALNEAKRNLKEAETTLETARKNYLNQIWQFLGINEHCINAYKAQKILDFADEHDLEPRWLYNETRIITLYARDALPTRNTILLSEKSLEHEKYFNHAMTLLSKEGRGGLGLRSTAYINKIQEDLKAAEKSSKKPISLLYRWASENLDVLYNAHQMWMLDHW